MFRNFINTIRRYKISSLLNILGLTVAFTAFLIIMIQVNFDLGFDMFHPKGDRTYRVEITIDGTTYSQNVSRPTTQKIIEMSPSIEAGSVFKESNFGFYLPGGSPDESTQESLLMVNPDFFKVIDFDFIEGDASRASDRGTMIISEKIAKKLFPGEKALGKELRYNKSATEVVTIVVAGVYRDFPKNSFLESNSLIWDIGDSQINNTSEWSYSCFLTLRDAAQKEQIEALLENYAKDVFKKYEKFGFRLRPITELHFSTDLDYYSIPIANRTTINILLGVAIIILLIAAINFLNFAMALTPLRLRSINIHKIYGGTVAKLRLYQISEAVIMSLIAFGLAVLAVKVLAGTSFPTLMSAPLDLSLNVPIVLMGVVVAIVTGVLAGIIPAFYSTSFQPVMVLKGVFGSSTKGRKFRTALIGFQYVSSIVLFCTALFMILQNSFMKNHPVGFDRDNILCAQVSNTASSSSDALKAKLMENPIIKDVAFSRGLIISDGKMGWGREYKGKNINFDCFPVSVNFLKFMGMEIVDGRDFTDDDDLKDNGTFIFNEKAAAELGIKVGDALNGHADSVANVVGIVRNFNFQPMQYGINPIALYVFGSKPWWNLNTVNVRVVGQNIPAAIAHIEKVVKEIDPKMSEVNVTFMDTAVGDLYEKEQKQATLIVVFAMMAMIISLVGVFGLVVFETQYRRKEVGLRKINGATVGLILAMFNRKFLWIVGICFVISVPIIWYAVSEWLSGFAYRTPLHWWVFAASLLVVLLLTVITVTVQSWRAATENPVKSLKSE